MKKKIVSLAIVLMMFMGVVSASSINGEYNGNPIVKVMSNGKQLQSDEVPAMIYDGHTVVPISLLRQIGASVEWNADTYSVDVKLPQPSPVSINSSKDVQTIKLFSKISNHYYRVSLLGDILSGLGGNYSLSFEAINTNRTDSGDSLKTSYERFNKAVSNYNDLLVPTTELLGEAGKQGVFFGDINNILSKYKDALPYYEKSINGLNAYYYSRSNKDFDAYLDNLKIADAFVNPARSDSGKKYYEWYSKTQNY